MFNPIGVRLTKALTFQSDLETLKEWYAWLKENGFGAVDVQSLTPPVKKAVEEAGLAIGSFDVAKVPQLFSKDAGRRNDAAASVREQLTVSAGLGGRVCFMCLKPEDNDLPKREAFDMFREVFPSIVDVAEHLGIQIVLEGFPGPAPHYPSLGCTPEMLRAMFEAVPSKALGINYDPSHLVRLGIDYMRFLREFADRIGFVHAKDCQILTENVYMFGRSQKAVFDQPIQNSEGPWRYVIPGQGEVDWAAVAFELHLIGYTDAVSIELEDHRYNGSVSRVREGLLQAQAHLRIYI